MNASDVAGKAQVTFNELGSVITDFFSYLGGFDDWLLIMAARSWAPFWLGGAHEPVTLGSSAATHHGAAVVGNNDRPFSRQGNHGATGTPTAATQNKRKWH